MDPGRTSKQYFTAQTESLSNHFDRGPFQQAPFFRLPKGKPNIDEEAIMATQTKTATAEVLISAPRFQTAKFTIEGTTPLVISKFSKRKIDEMKGKQEAGSQGKKGAKKTPKDFQANYEEAKYIAREGWCGINAAAFRAAMIRACSLVGFKMTIAKLSVFVEADGYDADDHTPLVKISKGKAHYWEGVVRNATGVVDIRPRPMWDEGWQAELRVRFDEDQFSITDVSNLLMRVGQQVGICEGRPNSRSSTGLGYGLFTVKDGA